MDGPASSVGALARVEGSKLTRHPAFLVGLAMLVFGIAMFVRSISQADTVSFDDDAWLVGAGAFMLAILTMVAANLATLRDRREDTGEQHRALPVGLSARTGALLASLLWPAAVLTLLLGGVAVYSAAHTDLTAVDRIQLASAVVTILMLGALGVALGRWVPHTFAAIVLAVALYVVHPEEQAPAWQALAPFEGLNDSGLAMWHLCYLAGLTVLFACAALARTSRSHLLALVALLGMVVVVWSAVELVSGVCPSSGRCDF